jgi:outer membrane protein
MLQSTKLIHTKRSPEQIRNNHMILHLNKVYSILFFVAILFIWPSAASTQNVITLSQAIQNGLANKKSIAAGQLDITLAGLQTKSLYSKYRPLVTADYTYRYNPILPTSILPIGIFNPAYPIDATESVQFGTTWTQSAGLTIKQPLLDISVQRQIAESKLEEKIALAVQQMSEWELIYAIADSYIAIYLNEASIQSLIADTVRTSVSYVLLKNQYDEQRLLKTDLNKAKVNHNNTCQLLVDSKSLLVTNKTNLLFLMGSDEIEKRNFDIDTNFFKGTGFDFTDKPVAVEMMPALQELKLLSQLTVLQSKSEKAKHLPTLTFSGYLGANQFSNSFNPLAADSWFGLSYIGLDLMLPLISGENFGNKNQQFNLLSDQYGLQIEDKTAQYAYSAFTAKVGIENIKKQLVTQFENILLTEESVAIYQMQVKEGKESAATLNLEEATLQVLKRNYDYTERLMWVYILDYLNATGQLPTLIE